MHAFPKHSPAGFVTVLFLAGCTGAASSGAGSQAAITPAAGGQRTAIVGLPASTTTLFRQPLDRGLHPAENPTGNGLLYVADLTNQNITIYKARVKNPPQIGEITQGVDGPYTMALTKAGTLYVPNSDNNTVTVYPPGATAPKLTITAGINTPVNLTLDHSGTLYVSNFSGNTITVYPKGQTTPSKTISSSQFVNIDGLAVDSHDNLYVADFSAVKVFEIAKGTSTPQALNLDGLADPVGLAIDSHDNLYASNPGGNDVDVYAPGQPEPTLRIMAGLSEPYAVAIGPKDMLFVSNLYSTPAYVNAYRYGRQAPWETISPFAGPTGLAAKRI